MLKLTINWFAHRLIGLALAAAFLAVLSAPLAAAGALGYWLTHSSWASAYAALLGAPVSWWLARQAPRAWLGALLRCWAWPRAV